MRVISGKARGVTLKTPDGLVTRPTSDRVKEALFSIIQFDLPGARVLDLFGGSGQLAIEAISRGAESALVVDNSRKAIDVIKENIKNCHFENDIRVHMGDYTEVLTKGAEYDVIFLDPPYASELLKKAIELIVEFDILSKDGIIVCETDSSSDLSELFREKYTLREYKYGRIKLSVIRNS